MSSSNNNHCQGEEDQLYDILDLSPPSLTKPEQLTHNLDSHLSINSLFIPGNNFKSNSEANIHLADNYELGDFSVNKTGLNDLLHERQANPNINISEEFTDNSHLSNHFQKNANINLSNSPGLSLYSNNLQGMNSTTKLSNDLLSPANFKYSGTSSSSSYNQQQLLNPRSPSSYSLHSLYSDAPSNPGSPFLDAMSHFSNHTYSDIGHNPTSQLTETNQYLDANASNSLNAFDTEIALGGSISSTNLIGLNQQPPHHQLRQTQQNQSAQFNFSLNDQQVTSDYGPSLANSSSQLVNQFNRLTENNLINYNNSIQQQEFEQKEITISIQKAPEEVAAKTPSLFSNSSANSSAYNSPHNASRPRTCGEVVPSDYSRSNNLVPNSQYSPSSPGSVVSDVSDISDANSLLKPEEFQNIRNGRKKSHSIKSQHGRSRSRPNSRSSSQGNDNDSDNDDNDDDSVTNSVISSREKMLELASPNQSSKRTQKHPSVYACHLCDKRFTRPYNLKSHLRTHTDERPFICNVCGKAFARQHDRKRHEDLHTGEKKFQCKGFLKDGTPYGCGRKFARADALRRHFQTEAGKECIRLLMEEDEKERQKNGQAQEQSQSQFHGLSSSQSENSNNDYLSPNSIHPIPQVAISPPE